MTLITQPLPPKKMARRTSEESAALAIETNWINLNPLPDLAIEDHEPVGLRMEPCPLCNDSGTISVSCRGEMTGFMLEYAFRCRCYRYKFFWDLYRSVPQHYRGVNLDDPETAPRLAHHGVAAGPDYRSGESAPGQQLSVFWAARYRKDSSLLCPLPICDSSMHFHADPAGGHVALRLAGGHRRASRPDQRVEVEGQGRRERVVSGGYRRTSLPGCQQGYRPELFLDELDKFTPTETRMNELFKIVDAVNKANGRIVTTMNGRPEDLQRRWGVQQADAVIRRISGETEGGFAVFFG